MHVEFPIITPAELPAGSLVGFYDPLHQHFVNAGAPSNRQEAVRLVPVTTAHFSNPMIEIAHAQQLFLQTCPAVEHAHRRLQQTGVTVQRLRGKRRRLNLAQQQYDGEHADDIRRAFRDAYVDAQMKVLLPGVHAFSQEELDIPEEQREIADAAQTAMGGTLADFGDRVRNAVKLERITALFQWLRKAFVENFMNSMVQGVMGHFGFAQQQQGVMDYGGKLVRRAISATGSALAALGNGAIKLVRYVINMILQSPMMAYIVTASMQMLQHMICRAVGSDLMSCGPLRNALVNIKTTAVAASGKEGTAFMAGTSILETTGKFVGAINETNVDIAVKQELGFEPAWSPFVGTAETTATSTVAQTASRVSSWWWGEPADNMPLDTAHRFVKGSFMAAVHDSVRELVRKGYATRGASANDVQTAKDANAIAWAQITAKDMLKWVSADVRKQFPDKVQRLVAYAAQFPDGITSTNSLEKIDDLMECHDDGGVRRAGGKDAKQQCADAMAKLGLQTADDVAEWLAKQTDVDPEKQPAEWQVQIHALKGCDLVPPATAEQQPKDAAAVEDGMWGCVMKIRKWIALQLNRLSTALKQPIAFIASRLTAVASIIPLIGNMMSKIVDRLMEMASYAALASGQLTFTTLTLGHSFKMIGSLLSNLMVWVQECLGPFITQTIGRQLEMRKALAT